MLADDGGTPEEAGGLAAVRNDEEKGNEQGRRVAVGVVVVVWVRGTEPVTLGGPNKDQTSHAITIFINLYFLSIHASTACNDIHKYYSSPVFHF
jgi:hypothetical protein